MAVTSVYRVWVCYGSLTDTSQQAGNPALVATIYTERIFGDFASEMQAGMNIQRYLTKFSQENPKKQIPSFKIIEHKVNENNEDIFFDNSND
jgi:hypothetical protein